jgi:hypothetical protein
MIVIKGLIFYVNSKLYFAYATGFFLFQDENCFTIFKIVLS